MDGIADIHITTQGILTALLNIGQTGTQGLEIIVEVEDTELHHTVKDPVDLIQLEVVVQRKLFEVPGMLVPTLKSEQKEQLGVARQPQSIEAQTGSLAVVNGHQMK